MLTAPPQPNPGRARAVRILGRITRFGAVLTAAFGLLMLWQLLFAPRLDVWPGPDSAPLRPAPVSVPSEVGVLVPTGPLGPGR